MKHAGIILAAGASSRMGQPKALLATNDNVPLAQRQVHLLHAADCDPVIVVLGADYERIQARLADCLIVYNPDWRTGRTSSVQAGLRAMDADGCVILPIDTVGVAVSTIRATCLCAEESDAKAVRPTYQGQNGKIAWISRALAQDVIAMDSQSADARLDHLLDPIASALPVGDSAILRNVNTPEEWEQMRRGLHSPNDSARA